MKANEKDKSLESWIWNAACSIRGARDAPKYKDYILPLIFTKRLCDVFDDELDCIADTLIGWKEEEKFSRIVEDLNAVETEARATDKALRKSITQLGI